MNAYEILGVASNASDDDVKAAYRRLAKKYHPDNFAENPDIAGIMSQKMLELNQAYDAIIKARKDGTTPIDVNVQNANSNNTSSSSQSSAYTNPEPQSYQSYQTYSAPNSEPKAQQNKRQNKRSNNPYSTVTNFPEVRRLIMDSRFEDAEAVLNGIATERRNAEWNFLKGTVTYQKGQLEQAYTYLNAAVQMDPGNSEFKAAFTQASNMRNGSKGGYRTSDKSDNKGCSACNLCCSMMCADQCCECCGGDLISCC